MARDDVVRHQRGSGAVPIQEHASAAGAGAHWILRVVGDAIAHDRHRGSGGGYAASEAAGVVTDDVVGDFRDHRVEVNSAGLEGIGLESVSDGEAGNHDRLRSGAPYFDHYAGALPVDGRIGRTCGGARGRSEEHTSELQSLAYLVCRLLLEKK